MKNATDNQTPIAQPNIILAITSQALNLHPGTLHLIHSLDQILSGLTASDAAYRDAMQDYCGCHI